MELKNRFAGLPTDADFMEQPNRKRPNKRGNTTVPLSFFKPSHTNPDTCPKFLLVEHADPNQTLLKVSPFTIQKGLDMVTKGLEITRLRNGNLLVKTKNNTGAEKLLAMTSLGGVVGVAVKSHPTLNQSKGVITCRDLMYETEENITSALAKQHVTNTQRIKRRQDGKLVDTAALILTFRTPDIPDTIQAAFYTLKVRPYIPSPLRCTKCQKFGHSRGRCKNEEICAKCAQIANHEHCEEKKCVNCLNPHYSFDRKCPRYVEEAEVTKIKTIYRLTYPEARKQYQLKFPTLPQLSYTDALKSYTQKNSTENQQNKIFKLPTLQTINIPKNQSTNILSTEIPIPSTSTAIVHNPLTNHTQTKTDKSNLLNNDNINKKKPQNYTKEINSIIQNNNITIANNTNNEIPLNVIDIEDVDI